MQRVVFKLIYNSYLKEKIMEYNDFLNKLSSPARRALENEGIDSFLKLASLSKKELLAKHGIGRTTIPLVNEYLNKAGLKLKD